MNDAVLAYARLKELVFWVSVANAALSSILAIYLILITIKIFRTGKYPPPGMRVIKVTKVRTGLKAKLMATLLLLTSVLALSTNIVMYYLHQILDNQLTEAIKTQQLFLQ
jgi:hypothetical protein